MGIIKYQSRLDWFEISTAQQDALCVSACVHVCVLPDRVVTEGDSQRFQTAQQLCVSVV